MVHSPEVKERVFQMYKEGTPPRCIAEALGIPQSTVYGWVQSLMSRHQDVFNCAECSKEAVRKRPSRKYCSPECKRRARYKRENKITQVSHECKECGTQFQARANQLYCSKRCKNRVAKRRQRIIETLEEAIRDAPDGRIKRADYETEISTITHFLTDELLPDRQKKRVQNIQNRVV